MKGKLTMSTMLGVALLDVRGLLHDLLEKLSGEGWEIWLSELKHFLRKEPCWVPGKLNPYLNRITVGTLKARTGRRTLVKARKLFPGYFDSDYVNWGTDVPGRATAESIFEVYEMTKDGTFAQIFESFGVDLEKLCWSQDQIISFVENHADKLHPKGGATFCLFKVGNKFFVAFVYRSDDGQLKASVDRLSDGCVWRAEYRRRFVVPQQPL